MSPLQTHIPSAPLSDYSKLFWAWDNYLLPHPQERILPFGMMELTINLADTPFCITYPQADNILHRFSSAIVTGARSEFFVIDTSRTASLLSVFFKAGGALTFFGATASELHNRHVPLNLLWGNFANDLYCQLQEAKTT